MCVCNQVKEKFKPSSSESPFDIEHFLYKRLMALKSVRLIQFNFFLCVIFFAHIVLSFTYLPPQIEQMPSFE